MTPKEIFKSAGINRKSFQAKSDDDEDKIHRVIYGLKTLGFDIIKDPEGNSYQFKAVKGHEAVIINHRFGNTGRPAIWIQEGKKVKTKQQLLEDKLRPMIRKILKEEGPVGYRQFIDRVRKCISEEVKVYGKYSKRSIDISDHNFSSAIDHSISNIINYMSGKSYMI